MSALQSGLVYLKLQNLWSEKGSNLVNFERSPQSVPVENCFFGTVNSIVSSARKDKSSLLLFLSETNFDPLTLRRASRDPCFRLFLSPPPPVTANVTAYKCVNVFDLLLGDRGGVHAIPTLNYLEPNVQDQFVA